MRIAPFPLCASLAVRLHGRSAIAAKRHCRKAFVRIRDLTSFPRPKIKTPVRPHRGFLDRRKSFKNHLPLALHVVSLRACSSALRPSRDLWLWAPEGVTREVANYCPTQRTTAIKTHQCLRPVRRVRLRATVSRAQSGTIGSSQRPGAELFPIEFVGAVPFGKKSPPREG